MICFENYFQLPTVVQITVIILCTLSSIIAALGNTFCLIVLWQLSQRSKSNKILTSLTLSDCLVGYVSFPLFTFIINYAQDANSTTCRIIDVFSSVTLWLTSCSTCSIVFISYDRYTFITKSSHYDDILTNRKIYIIMGVICLFNLIFGIGYLVEPIIYMLGNLLVIVISVITLCGSYYYVWKAFKQSGKRNESDRREEKT